MAEFSRTGRTLSFGLISTPVRLTGAVEKETTPRLNTLCVGEEYGDEHAPVAVKQLGNCTVCGPLHDKKLLRKGRPQGDGFVIVDTDDVATAKAETGEKYKNEITFTAHKATDVLESTSPNGVLYYLEPEGNSKAYCVLRDLIQAHPEVSFVALYTVVSRIGMYVARVHDGAIVLEGLHRESELKPAPSFDEAELEDGLLQIAEKFLESQVAEFDAASYADTYVESIKAMLEASTPVAAAMLLSDEGTGDGGAVDLMAALEAEMKKKESA